MTDLTEKSKFSWPVIVVIVGLAFSAGGAWLQLSSHGAKLDDHETRLRDHEQRVQKSEDHYEAIRQWMADHK